MCGSCCCGPLGYGNSYCVPPTTLCLRLKTCCIFVCDAASPCSPDVPVMLTLLPARVLCSPRPPASAARRSAHQARAVAPAGAPPPSSCRRRPASPSPRARPCPPRAGPSTPPGRAGHRVRSGGGGAPPPDAPPAPKSPRPFLLRRVMRRAHDRDDGTWPVAAGVLATGRRPVRGRRQGLRREAREVVSEEHPADRHAQRADRQPEGRPRSRRAATPAPATPAARGLGGERARRRRGVAARADGASRRPGGAGPRRQARRERARAARAGRGVAAAPPERRERRGARAAPRERPAAAARRAAPREDDVDVGAGGLEVGSGATAPPVRPVRERERGGGRVGAADARRGRRGSGRARTGIGASAAGDDRARAASAGNARRR